MQIFEAELPPLSEDEGGVIRVDKTRVSLESVVTAFDRGASAEEIADRFPPLELGAIYGAIAYVLAHRDRVDAYMARRKAEVLQARDLVEQRFPAKGLRERLLARRGGMA